jgi:glycine cleavage system H protein
MNIPEQFYYTKEHEWISVEGEKCKAGITDYAQHSLGDITFVELPAEGKEIEQFGNLGTVESVKAASDIYAPVSGKIAQVNEKLTDKPELLNQSPYQEGWLVVIEMKDKEELNNLMKAEEYKKYVEGLE